MRRKGSQFIAICAVAVSGCAQSTPFEGIGAGELPSDTFPLRSARVVSQTGDNLAIIETTGLANQFSRGFEVRRAAAQWCKAGASASRVSADRTRLSLRETFLVQCR